MPTQPTGMIVLVVLCTTWILNVLFGVLIARATYRALIHQDANSFVRCVLLNDSLDRIRSAVVNEAATWSSI